MSGLFSSAASSAATNTLGDLKSDVALSDPPTDAISDLAFSPAPNGPDFLAVASWDNKVRIYEIAQNGQSQGRHAYEHTQPVFSCDFSKVRINESSRFPSEQPPSSTPLAYANLCLDTPRMEQK
jgi:mRNA export factor